MMGIWCAHGMRKICTCLGYYVHTLEAHGTGRMSRGGIRMACVLLGGFFCLGATLGYLGGGTDVVRAKLRLLALRVTTVAVSVTLQSVRLSS